MPIYAYKCAACGHAKDALQKMSDAPLTVCPACGQASFQKQLTSAGFQLKGSGWYATDFRNGNTPPAPSTGEASSASAESAEKPTAPAAKPAANAAATPVAPAAASPAATSAPSSSGV